MKNTAKKIEKISGISLALFLAAAIIIIFLSGIDCGQEHRIRDASAVESERPAIDPNAKSGIPPEKSREEIIEELNRAVSAGKMTVTINSNPHMDADSKTANINAVNISGNPYAQQVEIFYGEESIYKSGLIPVGSYINEAKLNVDLPVGSYSCNADINSVLPDGSIIGTVNVKLKLDVREAD